LSFDATITQGPRQITLYDAVGKSIQVLESDKQYWLDQGFTDLPFEPKELLNQFKQELKSLGSSMDDLVKGTLDNGAVDVADNGQAHVASTAMANVRDTYNRLFLGLHTSRPNAEPQPVEMTQTVQSDQEGVAPQRVTTLVDPNQVDFHTEQGWAKA